MMSPRALGLIIRILLGGLLKCMGGVGLCVIILLEKNVCVLCKKQANGFSHLSKSHFSGGPFLIPYYSRKREGFNKLV